MRYAEFADLCQREFARDGGSVTALRLTGPSAAELAADIFTTAQASGRPPMLYGEIEPDTPAGARVSRMVNPVTLASVPVRIGPDIATVTYGPLGRLTRTVEPARPEATPTSAVTSSHCDN